jgi:hypothetical protein
MVSKNLKIIIRVLFALYIAFGCLGSGSENKQVQTVEAPAVQAEPVQTVTTTAAATETQDEEWLRTSRNWYLVIGQDMTDLGAAGSSENLEEFYKSAKQTKSNIENAKKADSKLSPSAKYGFAHDQYIESLDNIENAMDLIISCGDGGWTDKQKITEATKSLEAGKLHIDVFTSAVKNA